MTLTRSVSWESIRVFIACNTTYWGFYCWPLLIQADKIKWIGRKETRGGERNIGHDSGLIEYDQMIEGLCKKKKCSKQKDASFHYKESHCADYNKVCHNPSNNIAFWTGYNYVRRKSIYTTGNKRSYANFYHQQLSKHQQKVSDLSRGENSSYVYPCVAEEAS